MKKTFVILLILIVGLGTYFLFKLNQVDNKNPSDSLSEKQVKNLENAGTDNTSTFKDSKFPDGSSMEEWQKQNDPNWTPKFN